MRQLRYRILDWWYSHEALLKLVALVVLCLWIGAVAGYCLGCHCGYVAACEGIEIMKGR